MVDDAICIDCGQTFLRYTREVWKVRCLGCWAIAKARREGRATSRAPQPDPLRDELRERLRALLSLCHPDRHGNSALATSTTQWLLQVRERISDKAEAPQ